MAERAERIVAIEQRPWKGNSLLFYAFALRGVCKPLFPLRISTHLTEEPYFLESPFIANGKRQ